MTSQQQTYSPAQYLDAGFRAEMGGEHDRAAQYYVYLVEAFPDTPEGEAARGGLLRMGRGARGEPVEAPREQRQSTGPRGTNGHHHAETRPAAAAQPRSTANGQAPARHPSGYSPAAQQTAQHGTEPRFAEPARIRLGDLARLEVGKQAMPAAVSTTAPTPTTAQTHAPAPGYGQPTATAMRSGMPAQPVSHDPGHGTAAHDHGGHSTAAAGTHAGIEQGEPMRLPEVMARRARELAEAEAFPIVSPRYRGARILAITISWLGWIIAASGIALLLLGMFGMSGVVQGSVAGIAGSVAMGLAAIGLGAMLALGGRVSLAIFDQADHLREIGALLRARDSV